MREVVSPAKTAVDGELAPSVQKGKAAYAEWLIVELHARRVSRPPPHRRLLDTLSEMSEIVVKFDLKESELSEFQYRFHAYTRSKDLDVRPLAPVSRADADNVAPVAIDPTDFDRFAVSKHCTSHELHLQR